MGLDREAVLYARTADNILPAALDDTTSPVLRQTVPANNTPLANGVAQE
jgi:hypothetical protein